MNAQETIQSVEELSIGQEVEIEVEGKTLQGFVDDVIETNFDKKDGGIVRNGRLNTWLILSPESRQDLGVKDPLLVIVSPRSTEITSSPEKWPLAVRSAANGLGEAGHVDRLEILE